MTGDSTRPEVRSIAMRRLRIALVVLAAGCVPSGVVVTAGDRLGVHGKRLHLEDYDRIGDSDIYTFCRYEHRRDVGNLIPVGGRTYDGACITLVCPTGDNGHHCR